MKERIHNTWNNFRKQPDIWLFFGFILISPLSIRKVVLFFPIQKTFNEYTSVYLYISDILLFLTFLTFIFYLLCNNTLNVSRHKAWTTPLFHNLYIIVPTILIIISFLSIYWSQNQVIAFFRSLKLFEAYLIYLYTIFRLVPAALFHVEQFGTRKNQPLQSNQTQLPAIVPRGTIHNQGLPLKNCSTWNNFLILIILSGTFQSVVAIWQFIIQHSIGFFWLKESLISPSLPGVAKFILDGHNYIRAYGLFPHPNILGGFLLFSIIITILYKNTNASYLSRQLQLFHVEQYFDSLSAASTTPNDTHRAYFPSQKLKIKKAWLIYGILWLQVIALILTFSKSAIIGFMISLAYIKLFHVEQFDIRRNQASQPSQVYSPTIVPRGTIKDNQSQSAASQMYHTNCSTWNNYLFRNLLQHWHIAKKRLFHVEHLKKIALCGLSVIILIFLLKPNFNAFFLQSLEERSFFLNVSRGTILANPILGIGAGQFVLNIPEYTQKAIKIWQFQPVHNIYLLMWSELGMITLVLFLWLIFKLFHVEQFKKEERTDQIVPRGTIQAYLAGNESGIEAGNSKQKDSILCNIYYALSMRITLRYFQGILLGFLFISLFDHYFWDIWPGQVLFWLVMGIIAGIKISLDKRLI